MSDWESSMAASTAGMRRMMRGQASAGFAEVVERIVPFTLSGGFGGGCDLAMCLGQGRFHSSPVSRSK